VKPPKPVERLLRDDRARNGVAIVAGLCTIALFLQSTLSARASGGKHHNMVVAFLLLWWPDLAVVPVLVFIVLYIWSEVMRSIPVIVEDHRLISITAHGGHSSTVQPDEPVRLTSHEEHFAVLVQGRIRGPELRDLLRHFRIPSSNPGHVTGIPIQIIVSERSTKFSSRWWPQNAGEFRVDGTYEAPAFLGGTGPDSAKDGSIFELRLLILRRGVACLGPSDVLRSLDELPKHVFLSEPQVVQALRQ